MEFINKQVNHSKMENIAEKIERHSTALFILALVVRIFLVVYGTWQDEHFAVKYSDIDYAVVTDGARLLYDGKSPYGRTTYRYTPLLAALLVPNITFHSSFGKCLFVAFDFCSAYLVYALVRELRWTRRQAILGALGWLWNPLSLSISTRGSGDSIVCAQVLFTLLGLVKGRFEKSWPWLLCSAVVHGLSVHWRLFPIVFAPTILVFLDTWPQRIAYGFVSGTTFLALGLGCYLMYRMEFVHETFLYHLSRSDIRHNFSVWFYALYLGMKSEYSSLVSLVAFLPQIVTQAAIIYRFGKIDISYSFFLQTWAFVVFNKVVTAQYFLWYISLLPVCAFSVSVPTITMLTHAMLPWMLSEVHWLFWGYTVEFLGLSTFKGVFLAGVVFFIVNVYCICNFIRWHQSSEGGIKKD